MVYTIWNPSVLNMGRLAAYLQRAPCMGAEPWKVWWLGLCTLGCCMVYGTKTARGGPVWRHLQSKKIIHPQSVPGAPRSRKAHCSGVIVPAARSMAVAMRKEKSGLCASKRPRHTMTYMNSVVNDSRFWKEEGGCERTCASAATDCAARPYLSCYQPSAEC